MIEEQFHVGNIDRPGRITEKAWGREKLITNGKYCGKIMEVDEGAVCSVHYHLIKDETFLVLEGMILLTLYKASGEKFEQTLQKGDTIHIPAGVAHSFLGITDATMLEISTYDNPTDSRRFTKSQPALEVGLE